MGGELHQGTRQYQRVSTAFRVRFDHVGTPLIGLCTELSCGGLFAQTASLLPINAVLRVHLELPDRAETSAIGRVAYVRNAEAPSGAGVGMEFIDLDAACDQ